MPTENRSSNTEMVLVPRELTPEMRQAYEAHSLAPVGPISKTGYLAMLDAAPAQHQGEPVAWLLFEGDEEPVDFTLLPEVAKAWPEHAQPLYTHPAPAEQQDPVAVLYANGTVLTKADCGDVFDICCKVETPLYTQADPGEVERLRGQVNEWAGKWERAISAGAVMEGQRNTLRAQLTEAHALFARILGKRDTCAASYWFEEIQALLSASAEPSAPKCETCSDHGIVGNILNAEPCPDCSYSAPVERDERADFEALHDKTWPRSEFLHLSHHEYGKKLRWEGWQARADLERKP
ncbi:hypothetical protein [Pseudomonas monteilii]|uniref:hypothetical protein n=1 Tax=Pseudomonas monteilii TaxID=76759 RepID=UPI0018A45CE7|nr:hypothetical protein [Pseudomonas monteilii]BBV96413.1 hypothetical protein STW0522PSE72_17640 [Pseudomonas monteilii]